MAKKYKNGKMVGEPSLVRAMRQRQALRDKGQETAFWDQEIERLQQDKREYFLATKWLIDLDRFTTFDQIRRKLRDEGICAALKRNDLTFKEGIQLLKTLQEAESETESEARRQLGKEWEAWFYRSRF